MCNSFVMCTKETMNQYLMFGRTLQCKLVEYKDLHPNTFKAANKQMRIVPWQRIAKERHNAKRSPGL